MKAVSRLAAAALVWIAIAGGPALHQALARDLEYANSEMSIYVNPGEPTEIRFPASISGGFKRKGSTVSIDKRDDSLIVSASEGIGANGEAIIVRLGDGRSYSMRIQRATPENERDAVVTIKDERGSLIASSGEEEPAYRQKNFNVAPPSHVSGLVREMVLVAELGKNNIVGYKATDAHRGERVIDDGTMLATIDRIFIGANLWGYVLDAQNVLDTSQKINPASFRLDGTRAISASNWELAAKPLNIEQQLSGKHKSKIYIVTRAKKTE